jgi:hypothetical protein
MVRANRENSPFQCFRPALAGAVAPARVRRDLALFVPVSATLAAVLSLYKKGALPPHLSEELRKKHLKPEPDFTLEGLSLAWEEAEASRLKIGAFVLSWTIRLPNR